MKALGWTYEYDKVNQVLWLEKGSDYSQIKIDLKNSQAQFRTQFQDRLNKLKRAYTAEAVRTVAARNHWPVRFADPEQGEMVRQ